MRLLAIDTATEACSVAVQTPQGVFERWVEAPREHGDRVLGMVDAVLDEAGIATADLDAIAFGRGPGAFTGVRIATALVQGMAAALNRPVVPVSTLAAIAQGVHRRTGHQQVLAALDARMGEVYWGAWALDEGGVMRAADEECVARPTAVPLPAGSGWVGAGTGWSRYEDILTERIGDALEACLGHALPAARDLLPAAAAAFGAGEAVPAEQALPVYLRDRVAERPRRSGPGAT
jgi:tRNA threonylcarbamoyladenosine biosynthesis protein TsaB